MHSKADTDSINRDLWHYLLKNDVVKHLVFIIDTAKTSNTYH